LKLPAQLVPDGATLEDFRRCLFDERIDEFALSYHQVVREEQSQFYSHLFKTFSDLLAKECKLSIGVSGGFLQYILPFGAAPVHEPLAPMPRWTEFISQLQLEQVPCGFGALMLHPQVEIICLEPYSSLSFYLDIDMFIQQTTLFKEWWEEHLGKNLSVAATTELCMNNEIYQSFAKLPFNAAIMEGAEWVLQGREPSYLGKINNHLLLCPRHRPLSLLMMEIFSDPLPENITPRIKAIAQQIRAAPGDFVLLGWDLNALRSYNNRIEAAQISLVLSQLCETLNALGVTFSTVAEVATKFSDRARRLTLPAFTSTKVDGGIGYLLNSNTQQWIFQLIHHAYNMAKLSKNENLIDMALWLTQIDNLKLAAAYSAGLKPQCYRPPHRAGFLSSDELLRELGRVYGNFIKAARSYL
jgi:alpha-amylase